MQSVDYTTLIAAALEIDSHWIPARIEQVYQRDRYTLSLALRTLKQRGWLTICWHPQAARMCLSAPPPRTPDTFTFSDQLRHQLKGLALVASESIAPWERVIDLQFARRPGEEPLWHLYVEIMGKYSNVILTDSDRQIVTPAHQVSSTQSSVRPIQTGQPYHFPPSIVGTLPKLEESFTRHNGAIIAYSGGVDSSLLAYAAHRALGDKMVAVISDSPSLARREYRCALDFVHAHKIPIQIIQTSEMDNPLYQANQGNRCYYCKQALFEKLEDLQKLEQSEEAE